LKKRTKKLLLYEFLALRRRARHVAKSFCFFFQKEVLSSFVSVINNAGWYHMPGSQSGRKRWNGIAQSSG